MMVRKVATKKILSASVNFLNMVRDTLILSDAQSNKGLSFLGVPRVINTQSFAILHFTFIIHPCPNPIKTILSASAAESRRVVKSAIGVSGIGSRKKNVFSSKPPSAKVFLKSPSPVFEKMSSTFIVSGAKPPTVPLSPARALCHPVTFPRCTASKSLRLIDAFDSAK